MRVATSRGFIPAWRIAVWLVLLTGAVILAISDLMVWSGRDLLAVLIVVGATVWLVRS